MSKKKATFITPNIIRPIAKLEPSTEVYIKFTKSEKELMCPMLCPVNFSISKGNENFIRF